MTSVNNNWTDNLLVKEKDGQIHRLKSKQSFLSQSTAPANDQFSHTLGTDFSFHPDDHGELLQLAKGLPVDDSKKYSISKIVDRLIDKQGLHFDNVNKAKFTSLLFDFFRGRKKSFVVREALATQILSDNKPIDNILVDSIVSVIKGIKNKIDTVGGLVVDTEVSAPAPEPVPEPVPESAPKSLPIPRIEPVATPKLEPKIESETIAVPVKSVSAIPKSLPKVIRPQSPALPKKQVADVKYEKPSMHATLMGPIQELQSLTLKNFRYLGDNAQARIDKIYDKMHVLERQSFSKKAEGIKAWRQSPTYQLYLSLGADSMSQGQDILKTIDQYTKENKETLTLEEFSAISDLNKMIRF